MHHPSNKIDIAIETHKIVKTFFIVLDSLIMIDRLRQLAIFAKTVDHGSFRGAAQHLRLSPSVVSHHVSQLEASLGVALLYRSTRQLSLTRDGERLLAATQKLLEAVENELAAMSSLAPSPSGELRVMIASVLSASEVTARIARFARRFPLVRLTLDYSDARRDLIAAGFDVAIRIGPKPTKSPTTQLLFEAPRVIVGSTEYLAGRTPPRSPKDLLQFAWLSLTPARSVPLRFSCPGCQPITIKPDPQIHCSDAQALYRLIRAGAGVGSIPRFLADDDVEKGDVAEILTDWRIAPIHAHAVWPANAPKNGLIALFLGDLIC